MVKSLKRVGILTLLFLSISTLPVTGISKEDIIKKIETFSFLNILPKPVEPVEEVKPKVLIYDEPLAKDLQLHLFKECERFGVPKDIAMGVTKVETGWTYDNTLVSSVGAKGLFQVRPKTARWTINDMGLDPNLSLDNPRDNITIGVAHLKLLQKVKKQDSINDRVLSSYNMGIGGVEKFKRKYGTYNGKYARTVKSHAKNFKKIEVE